MGLMAGDSDSDSDLIGAWHCRRRFSHHRHVSWTST